MQKKRLKIISSILLINEGEFMSHINMSEWEMRLSKAKLLCGEGKECSMCGGTGAWPGQHGFVLCKPCSGTGLRERSQHSKEAFNK